MLILSLKFAVWLESPGPNSELCVPLYSHSLDVAVSSNWFPYIDVTWICITENACHMIAIHCCGVIHHACASCTDTKNTLLIVGRVCCLLNNFIIVCLAINSFWIFSPNNDFEHYNLSSGEYLSPRHGTSSGCRWRASRYGGWLRIYWISSRRQLTWGGPPAGGFGMD
jgi:hypothetical protein